MSKTGDQVIVDQARGLHVGVKRSTPDKSKPSLLHIRTQPVGNIGGRRHFPHCFPVVLDRFPIHKPPDVITKASELFLYGNESLCIGYGGPNFRFVANYLWIGKQLLNFLFGEPGYFLHFKVGEGFTIAFPFFEDGTPAETCLRTFQGQKLKLLPVIPHRHTPFPVVVLDILFKSAFTPVASLRHNYLF